MRFIVQQGWSNQEYSPTHLLDLIPVETKTIKIKRIWYKNVKDEILEIVGSEEKIPNWDVEIDYWYSSYRR